MPDSTAIAWSHCPPTPWHWLQLREPLLAVAYQPWLLGPLLGLLVWLIARRPLPVVVAMLLIAVLYSPIGTTCLSAWMQGQLPPSVPAASQPVAVLLGRGPQIAAVTTAEASRLVRDHVAVAVYVSGDAFATAQALQRQGVPAPLIAGDSCARTTWENATRTATWLRRHHPGAPVALITDPWQLPRAGAAFRRQGLVVLPIAVEPVLSPGQRNRLALRETAATLLYGVQGRL